MKLSPVASKLPYMPDVNHCHEIKYNIVINKIDYIIHRSNMHGIKS